MNIRGELEVYKMLAKSREGRSHLIELTRNRDSAMVIVQDDELLSTVYYNDQSGMSYTLAHGLVMSGHEDLHMELSKKPVKILELQTNGKDKVAEFIVVASSMAVRESLARNTDALRIMCGEALSESGTVERFGKQIRVVSEDEVKHFKGNSLAHMLLLKDPSDELVKIIACAPADILAFRNGVGVTVEDMLKECISKQKVTEISLHKQRPKR